MLLVPTLCPHRQAGRSPFPLLPQLRPATKCTQSVAPRKCSALTSCPERTARPRYSRLAFLVLALTIALLPIVYWALGRIDSSSTKWVHVA